MRELKKKVFLTLFGILTLITVVSLSLLNIENYKREYESLDRNLNIVDDRGNWMRPEIRKEIPPEGTIPEGAPPDETMPEGMAPEQPDIPGLENMMFMDHEVYTVEITDGAISRVISNGSTDSGFDATGVAEMIIATCHESKKEIGNLYLSDYVFSYRQGETIVIIHTAEIAKRLIKRLCFSLLLLVAAEILIILLTKLMTAWITRPAKDAFDKQRAFIADASHELKTPLAVIMASADEISPSGEEQKYVENIRYESDRMNKLITGLLDLSKLEAGVSREDHKEENLSAVVEKTCLVFEGVAFEQGVTIDTEIEEKLTMKCNKEEIERLVSILVDNAIKHSEKEKQIRVRLRRGKSGIALFVTNVGDPIAPGDEEKIFERFYRADASRSREENRYGLGLAIAKRIVKNHGGSIRAASKDGKTTFTVEFK